MCRERALTLGDYLCSRTRNSLPVKSAQSCQRDAMKTLLSTDCLWNHECFHEIGFHVWVSFWMCTFKSPDMSVWVCIKGCKNPERKLKLRGICKITLSIWHLRIHSPWEVSQDTLWHLKQDSWGKWIWHMLTQGTKFGYEAQHALLFNKISLHISDSSSDWRV